MAWPTTSEPRTNFLNLRLTDAEAAELDLYVQTTGQDRSTAARTALFKQIRADMAAVQATGAKTAPASKTSKRGGKRT